MILNDNTYLDFVEHIILKGATPIEYFKEILNRDMNGVTFNKRLYAIKHYILFGYLTNNNTGKYIKEMQNKILYYLLYIPRKIEK